MLLIIVIIFSRINVIVNYYHGQDNDDLKVEFKAWFGLIKYKIHVPLIKLDEDSPSIVTKEETTMGEGENKDKKKRRFTAEDLMDSFHDMKVILNHVLNLHRLIREFLHKVKVRNLQWDTEIGVGDAAYTGMLVGAFWGIKGGIIGIISHYMKMIEMPIIRITPNFQKAISQTKIVCMFQFRIGHAMFAAIKLVKLWKGGKPEFKSKSLSQVNGQ